MKKISAFTGLSAAICFLGAAGCAPQTGMSGEELFAQHCAACHPKGGNTVNAQKTLHEKDLEANHIRTPGDIVNKIRTPGVGMPQFNRDVITDRDATKIADYILSKFKKE